MGLQQPGWRHPSAQWLRECERKAALEARLPAFLRGTEQPASPAERIELALVCSQRQDRLHVAAVRFFTEAFAADPKLANDRRTRPRYDAACAAAQAAAGQGLDAAQLETAERARLRQQALDWLRLELTAWSEWFKKEPAKARPQMIKELPQWQRDPDFNSVRGTALAELREPERRDWEKLWKDLAAVLAEARAAK
jgi:hypothetical protein